MSERGSFCTEYIYCPQCFEACKQVLIGDNKRLKSIVIPCWTGVGELPIIAGKLGGSSIGDEFIDMEMEYIPKIQELMNDDCAIRICVHSDSSGSVIYKFDKDEILKDVYLDDEDT